LAGLQDVLIGGARGHAAVAKVGLTDKRFDDVQQNEAGTDMARKGSGVMERVF
jgi:hypothetical protein